MKRRLIALFLMMVILSSCIRDVKDSKALTLNDYDQRNGIILNIKHKGKEQLSIERKVRIEESDQAGDKLYDTYIIKSETKKKSDFALPMMDKIFTYKGYDKILLDGEEVEIKTQLSAWDTKSLNSDSKKHSDIVKELENYYKQENPKFEILDDKKVILIEIEFVENKKIDTKTDEHSKRKVFVPKDYEGILLSYKANSYSVDETGNYFGSDRGKLFLILDEYYNDDELKVLETKDHQKTKKKLMLSDAIEILFDDYYKEYSKNIGKDEHLYSLDHLDKNTKFALFSKCVNELKINLLSQEVHRGLEEYFSWITRSMRIVEHRFSIDFSENTSHKLEIVYDIIPSFMRSNTKIKGYHIRKMSGAREEIQVPGELVLMEKDGFYNINFN